MGRKLKLWSVVVGGYGHKVKAVERGDAGYISPLVGLQGPGLTMGTAGPQGQDPRRGTGKRAIGPTP